MAHTDRPDNTLNEHAFRTRAQQIEKQPPCQVGCPNSGDVRGWLGIIAQSAKHGLSLYDSYDAAWEELAKLNPFPATIGRICPHPCETRCSRDGKDGAVAINAMERFLGDWAIERGLSLPRLDGELRSESVGVIGSGPAGLSFAYQMARRGYPVTLYEKLRQPGGMLRHAIPEFRLPREIVDTEIRRVLDLGITLQCEVDPDKDALLEELRQQHKALFLGLGAQAAMPLGIPGEHSRGVVSGIGYLHRYKRGLPSPLGDRVIVIGGGNTAIDAARTARRDGASVTILYRRSRQEMPAAAQDVDDAMSEGVQFTFLATPRSVLADNNVVTGLEYQRTQLGEPDRQGRRRPISIDGRTGQLAADSIIVAVSQQPDWQKLRIPGKRRQWLLTEDDGKLADDLWAGGDDTGPGIASRAIAQGRLAAEAAHAELRGEPRPDPNAAEPQIAAGDIKTDFYEEQRRSSQPRRPQSQWLQQTALEIDQTISSEQASAEAARCFSCGLCFDCHQCIMYCNAGGFTPLREAAPGHYFDLALDACEGCGKCIELCPCGYLEIAR